MTEKPATALVAEDEPLLRGSLVRMLASAWPELEVLDQVRSGREAVDAFEARRHHVCFLDVHMPGMSGIEVARVIGRRAHIVFVTAFDQYAVEAFHQGAVDYLVKPVEAARLAESVARLRERLAAAQPAPDLQGVLEALVARYRTEPAKAPLRWVRVSVGHSIRLVSVDEIDYFRSDEKYTRVAWGGARGERGEGLIRVPLKDLLEQLDSGQFVQVHRSAVVAFHAISHVSRGPHETGLVHFKHREEQLPISRTYLDQFRGM
jgi:DNA-binding LytR/AlgR family response regulator